MNEPPAILALFYSTSFLSVRVPSPEFQPERCPHSGFKAAFFWQLMLDDLEDYIDSMELFELVRQ